jgi:hypothetical protein
LEPELAAPWSAWEAWRTGVEDKRRAEQRCDGIGEGRMVDEMREFGRIQSFKKLIDAPKRRETVIIETFKLKAAC